MLNFYFVRHSFLHAQAISKQKLALIKAYPLLAYCHNITMLMNNLRYLHRVALINQIAF
jgi:hypothetical protein